MECKGVKSFLKSNLNVQQDTHVYMHIYAYVCVYVSIIMNAQLYIIYIIYIIIYMGQMWLLNRQTAAKGLLVVSVLIPEFA